MDTLFALVFFISFILLILGLISPKLAIYWGSIEKKTRKRVLLYYGLAIIISFIVVGNTSPNLTPEEIAVQEQEKQLAAEKRAAEKKIADEKRAEEKKLEEEKIKKEAEEKAAAEKKKLEELIKQKEQELTELRNSAEVISYKNLARTPDNYLGNKVKFSGKVVQVIENKNKVELRVNTKEDEFFGYFEDTIYVTYTRDDNEGRILEDDIIELYGYFDGLVTYKTVLGSELTIPRVDARIIDLISD